MVGLLRQKTKNRLMIYDPRQKWIFGVNGIIQRGVAPIK
jgi:hypothetical protein